MSDRFWLGESEEKQWTLKDVYDDLIGRSDIARLLDVDLNRVISWINHRERNRCPFPIKRIGNTDVYSFEEWKRWYAAWIEQWPPDSKHRTNAKRYGGGTMPKSFWSYLNRPGPDANSR